MDFNIFSRNIENVFDQLPGSWQQSALSGNRWPAQFPMPQVRVPSHSLSLSQSPWFIPHLCSVVQQLQKLWHSEILIVSYNRGNTIVSEIQQIKKTWSINCYLFYQLQESSTKLVKLARIKRSYSSRASRNTTKVIQGVSYWRNGSERSWIMVSTGFRRFGHLSFINQFSTSAGIDSLWQKRY